MILALLQAFPTVHPEPPSLNPIDRWQWVFPVVESIHICAFSLFIGSIAILDLRIMGVILRGQTVSKLARALKPWILGGLIATLIAGPYLFSSDPGDYIQVSAFRIKMVLVVLAVLFHFTVIRRATQPDKDSSPPGWRKPAAGLSLALWICVMLAGLWIGNL